MRVLINILVALTLVALAAMYFAQQRSGEQTLVQEQQVRESLERLHERAAYHGALLLSETTGQTDRPAMPFPVAIEPAWFGGDQPGNVLASSASPWLDVAPRGDGSLNPPDPVLYHEDQAGVWYNPNNGVFRARTPPAAGDVQTLARYNRLNNTDLEALPRDADPARSPLAYTPGSAPALVLAHGANANKDADNREDVFFGEED